MVDGVAVVLALQAHGGAAGIDDRCASRGGLSAILFAASLGSSDIVQTLMYFEKFQEIKILQVVILNAVTLLVTLQIVFH